MERSTRAGSRAHWAQTAWEMKLEGRPWPPIKVFIHRPDTILQTEPLKCAEQGNNLMRFYFRKITGGSWDDGFRERQGWRWEGRIKMCVVIQKRADFCQWPGVCQWLLGWKVEEDTLPRSEPKILVSFRSGSC